MFSPGDIVVYHHHVCEVVSVRENYFEGKDYFELHALFENALKLFVAVGDAAPPALRPTMSREEALSLVDSIVDAESIDEDAFRPNAGTSTLLDRHIREEYDRHLKTFYPRDLIPIMKSVRERTLRRTDSGRQITATDKKYFELAEGLLCDELSISLDIERDRVKEFLVERVRESEKLA
ncbi:MAG: CarD family transcriptional regulator [Gordonibacter sp.]|nr:CarD family transcriptional regulator [Gordonibacter sp.]